jgi:hypothetical protein
MIHAAMVRALKRAIRVCGEGASSIIIAGVKMTHTTDVDRREKQVALTHTVEFNEILP